MPKNRSTPHIAAIGFRAPHLYTYGLYYWGLFPVYSPLEQRMAIDEKFDPAFAHDFLIEHADTLKIEHKHEMRFGDNCKFLLPLMEAYFTGRPGEPGIRRTALFFFASALILLMLSALYCRRPLLGAFFAIFLSSSDFQIYEMLRYTNFSFVITCAALVLACCLPLLLDRQLPRWVVGLSLLVAAAATVFFGNIRPSAFAVGATPLFALLLYQRWRWLSRFGAIALYMLLILSLKSGLNMFFEYKIKQANAFVTAVGGEPYRGERTAHHPLWHPIYCGLGDFDQTYGYRWSDPSAFGAARPELREAGYKPQKGKGYGDYHRLETNPHYAEIIRDKVITNIRQDPGWYLTILAKRVHRIFTEWLPPTVNYIYGRLTVFETVWPHLAWIIVLLLFGLFSEFKLIIGSLSSIAVAFAITTAANGHFYLITHFISASMMLIFPLGLVVCGCAAIRHRLARRAVMPPPDGLAPTPTEPTSD
ncbi:MAG: hypothetical protein O3A51_05870 [Verrucomicrobia bacterium]|nr:hypothetical protein [Verrucomicrobiota bacterium]